LWGHVEEVLLLNKSVFFDRRHMSQVRRHSSTKLSDGAKIVMFFMSCICS